MAQPLSSVRRRLRRSSLFALTLLPLVGATAPALASAAPVTLPSGGAVRAGQASFSAPGGSSLTLTQGSAKAIIDWASFSIDQGGTVRFDNGSGATLNRVTGAGPSSIDGLLSASGSVYLLNPNGVVIGKSGVVDVGGRFVASTLNVTDGAFLTGGDLTFTGGSTASMVNLGKVGALGGDVVLIASTVRNEGAITASKGDVGLLAGTQVLLRDQALEGGKFAVQLGGAGTSVTNSGAIRAAMAELRANGGDIYALAGNTGGVIRATGVSTSDGRVFLTGGDAGSVTLGGTISARGANGAGGAIETSAGQVNIGSAKIDAGPGGSWLLDPDDLTIDQTAANTMASTLNAGTNVTQQTTASGTGGSGDISVAANVSLSWNTNAGLTLSAYRNIGVGSGATFTSTGGAAVNFRADNTGTGIGTVNFGASAKVETSGLVSIYYDPASNPADSGINPTSYNNMTDFTGIIPYNSAHYGFMLVNTLNDLQNMQNNNFGSYALGRNIDATPTSTWNGGAGFAPITFEGGLDGLGHTIDGLYISRPQTTSVGLFTGLDLVAYGVENLTLTNVNITGGASTGALAGFEQSQLSKITVTGTVTGTPHGGGALGGGTGGIVGQSNGLLTDVSFVGTVRGGDATGGLVGDAGNMGAITNAYVAGSVSGGVGVGGLAGVNEGAISSNFRYLARIENAYVTASITGTSLVGGVVGDNSGVVTGVYASGLVSGGGSVGGLFGRQQASASITNGYWDRGTTGQAVAIGADQGSTTEVAGLGGHGGPSPYAQSSYAGFDFSASGAWVIFDGATRPMLRAEASSTITNGHQLQLIDLNRSGTYTLAGDVDLSATANASDVWNPAVGFVPIASRPGASDPFVGSLDGQGHTITNLTITSTYDNIGLFGNIGAAGTVQNLTLSNVNVTGGNTVGALAGLSLGAVSGVNVSGTVTGKSSVGGLVGSSLGTLSNDTSAAMVSGGEGCDGCQFAGGLVGYADGPISDSSATGAVSGYQYVGGLAGRVVDVSRSYALGSVTIQFHDGGGLVGQAFGTLVDDYATGNLSSSNPNSQNFGGLVGYLNGSGVISSSYASGQVAAEGNVGGLVGVSDGTISNAYAIGALQGSFGLGGLVGLVNGGSIDHVYATGQIQGVQSTSPITVTGATGGLIGYTGPFSPSLSNAYWDAASTGVYVPVGPNYSLVQTNVVRLGVDHLNPAYAKSTYTGLDFSASGPWLIFDGDTRPFLKSEASTTITTGHQLQLMALDPTADYKLANDIVSAPMRNASEIWNLDVGFVPVGSALSASQPFTGSFDGQGHLISGIVEISTANAVGMFGVVGPTGRISNLNLIGGARGGYYVGALVGDNYGTIFNIDFLGGATGVGGVGGLVGVSEGGSHVTSITTTLTYLNQSSGVGGSGSGDDVGGVIGVNLGTVSNAKVIVGADGRYNVGGLIGLNLGSVSNSSAAVTAMGYDSVGGLIGANAGAVTTSFATSSPYEGGPPPSGATVYTKGAGYAGGLVGFNQAGGSVSDSYSTAPSNVAGLVGRNDGVIARAYATGVVGASAAGIAALNNGSLLDTFWDVGTTGTTTGVASGRGSNVGVLPIGAGTSLDPLQASGYPGFDFTNVWSINPGVSRPTVKQDVIVTARRAKGPQ